VVPHRDILGGMVRIFAGCILLVVGGCGDDDSGGHVYDAAVDGVDALVAAGPHYHYVIDKVILPMTNTQARQYGLDLNGDATVDNQLGLVVATLASMGIDAQTPTTQSIDRGEADILVDHQTPDFTSAVGAGFTTYDGTNPSPGPCAGSTDIVCRHHLDGTGHFDLSQVSTDVPLVGPIVGGVYAGGPGHLTLRMPFLGGIPVQITLLGARAKLASTTATTITTGVIGGAVTSMDVNFAIVPSMQARYTGTVARDCTALTSPPACGCASPSEGKTLLGLFDVSPKDCSITVDEIRNNSLIVSLLAPDLTIEGQQAVSIGFGFTAVGATFIAP